MLTGSDTTPPYQISWNTTTASNGGHTLQSRAYDAAGNVGSSATVSVTVSNGGGGGGQLIVNGGFEGSAAPWTLAGDAYWSAGGNQHSGTGYTVLGFYNNASGSEYQTVTIPAGHPANLTFWLNITTSESLSTAYDFFYVEVRSTSGALLGTLGTFSNRNASAYSQKAFSLASWRGQTVRVQFRAHDRLQPDDGLPGRRRLAAVSDGEGGRPTGRPPCPDATISRRCPRPRSRSTSSSRRSEPSSPGFVITFDPDAVASRVAELEQELGEPGFWDDQARATAVSTEHSRLSKRLERYERLQREHDDAAELLELEPELAGDIESQLQPIRSELERLQEDALFNGEYDTGDAVVSVHSGAGGTDAQDWTEMLLRMYLRWAEDRGFQAELVEASPGEEAGLKSATFTAKGENAYGLFKAERGVHRLVRLSPFDSAHRRHTAFAQAVVAPLLPEESAVEIDEDDLRIDTYRASGAGGQHVNKTDSAVRITHLPTGIVVQCQNERSQTSNKQTALRILKSRLVELQEEQREAELAKERGAAQDIGFGSQIRSYVLQPYQLVKDLRTGYEVGNAQGVLDGNLDGFVREYLLAKAAGKAV